MPQLKDPALSRDKAKLAYVSEQENEKQDVVSSELWTASIDGSGAKRLTTGHIDEEPRWSPDGARIAFVRDRDIYLINADGSGLKAITKTAKVGEDAPEFSNDGRQLFFVRTGDIDLDADADDDDVIIDGPGRVVSYSLASGQESERFKSEDDVNQVVPNRADANEVFLRYDRYDPRAKTKYGDGAFVGEEICAAKLDGSGRRVLYRPEPSKEGQPEPKQRQLYALHSIASGLLVYSMMPDISFRIERLGEDGFKPFESKRNYLKDISLDGEIIVDTGLVTTITLPAGGFDSGLIVHSTATQQEVALGRDVLLPAQP